MRGALVVLICGAAACAAGTPGNPDAAKGGGADARVDASPQPIPDAPPGTPDAMPDAPPSAPDAMPPDAGVITGAPDTCAMALDITTGAHGAAGIDLSGDTTGYADDVSPSNGCTGFLPDGPDAIYVVTLAAGETITATATPGAWDISLELVTTCVYDPDCVAGADDNLDGVAETLTYTAPSATSYYLVVDGYNPGVEGPFTMNVAVH